MQFIIFITYNKMKTEHEKLKEIADKIWYELLLCNIKQYKRIDWIEWFFYVDVREIIFTPEFMGKFVDYKPSINMCNIFNNLDNPVEYLFDLLELWKQKH